MSQPLIMIDVLRHTGDWPDFDAEPVIAAAQQVVSDVRQGELSIVLTDDGHIQQLNRDFRGKDKPTNVLSFPQDGPLLGDIILALETVQREADQKGIAIRDHIAHLLIHGYLHLLGYDHQNEKEALQMETLEIKALAALNIDNPYEIDDDN